MLNVPWNYNGKLFHAIALLNHRVKVGDRTPNIHTFVSCDRLLRILR
ncbi:hypothetical protein KBT16_09835 [Nostoc sp. CCCryo 231-06]|nr:hypothetical protein [Nostoc sp. CCCryo 231-06]